MKGMLIVPYTMLLLFYISHIGFCVFCLILCCLYNVYAVAYYVRVFFWSGFSNVPTPGFLRHKLSGQPSLC